MFRLIFGRMMKKLTAEWQFREVQYVSSLIFEQLLFDRLSFASCGSVSMAFNFFVKEIREKTRSEYCDFATFTLHLF